MTQRAARAPTGRLCRVQNVAPRKILSRVACHHLTHFARRMGANAFGKESHIVRQVFLGRGTVVVKRLLSGDLVGL